MRLERPNTTPESAGPLFAQVLIGASFALAGYYDYKERAVSDLVWIPGAIGTVYALAVSQNIWFSLTKIGLIGGIGLAFVLYGALGEADAIAMALISADPNPLSPFPPLLAGAVVAMGAIGYQVVIGNAGKPKMIEISRFVKEKKWIPKALVIEGVRTEVDPDVNVAREDAEAKQMPGAMVEVSYGVPTVSYLAVGYVAYLVYLLVAYPGVLALA